MGKGRFNCGERGRYARESPKPPEGKGKGEADDRLCYNCGKAGHIAKGCPNATNGKGEGKSGGAVARESGFKIGHHEMIYNLCVRFRRPHRRRRRTRKGFEHRPKPSVHPHRCHLWLLGRQYFFTVQLYIRFRLLSVLTGGLRDLGRMLLLKQKDS